MPTGPSQQSAYALSLDHSGATDADLVGPQIALLARARAAGLPVPRSNCVTRRAFDELLAHSDEAPLPTDLHRTLAQWSRSFTPMRVQSFAVANGESTHDAGEPIFDVTGPQDLVHAVRKAWRQLSPVSTSSLRGAGVAVLVSDTPGVELSGSALSCAPGGVAGGAHLVRVDTGAELVLAPDGSVGQGSASEAGLERNHLEQLLQLLQACAELLNGPAHISWSLRQRRIWLTQLRPQQGGVHRVVHLGARAPEPEVWSNFSLREDFRLPMGRLSFCLWRDNFLPIVFESLVGLPQRATRERRMLPVDLISGRLYWNVNRTLVTPVGAWLLKAAPQLDPVAGAELGAQLRSQRLDPPSLASLRKLWALWRSLLGFASVLRRALGGLRIAEVVSDCRRFVNRQLRIAQGPMQAIEDADLIAQIEQTLVETRDALQRGLAHELLGVVGLHSLHRLAPQISIGSAEHHSAGITPGSVALALRELAARARKIPGVADCHSVEALLAKLEGDAGCIESWQALLGQCGHRAPAELGLDAPRWHESPALLAQALLAALRSEGDSESSAFAAPASPSQLMEARAPASRFARWLGSLIERLILLRDFPRWAFAAGTYALRRLYLEAGRRMAERGLVERGDDVLMMEPEEVRDLLLQLRRQAHLIRARINDRRRDLERDRADRPPDTVRSDGIWQQRSEHVVAEQLRGVAGAKGRYRGQVCVVDDFLQAELRPGQVLVAKALTPGWAPLLANASALITEAGDWASHAAAMAREVGIPAVVGVAKACELLREVEQVEVDGKGGVVRLLDGAPASEAVSAFSR